ncbi:MAG: hypothetical protein HYX24_02460 [Candidatus Aenigmarchaeota archaeon]|nr:hypothetical protein [Candidatus Aenigmarchaeota archaeon]
MPNTCAKCGKIHPDDAPYLLNGCDSCGSKFFFFVRQDLIEIVEQERLKLNKQEIETIEKDIREIVEEEEPEESEAGQETVILDLEAIRVLKPGKYNIDVTKLFAQKPLVIRLAEGKYRIDLSTVFQRFQKGLGR